MKKDLLFLDANVLFSTAYREASGLLRFWELTHVELISSLYAIEEAKRNLASHQQERLKEILKGVREIDCCYERIILPKAIKINAKDEPILKAAISAKANFLITGDMKDFGKFYGESIEGVLILPPAAYLNSKTIIQTIIQT
ncbi:MAG: PIN domain-containing protein [Alphaproteobacteria bacterium]|nr:PIN domain-containing protein [Alphaproteobacteria bacterium]